MGLWGSGWKRKSTQPGIQVVLLLISEPWFPYGSNRRHNHHFSGLTTCYILNCSVQCEVQMLVFTYGCRKNKSYKVIPRSLPFPPPLCSSTQPTRRQGHGSLSGPQHSAHFRPIPFLLQPVFSFVKWVE